ncbi:hypothetical protein [Cupriavidus sp. TMH.W2]|uniref:hypothetical protein n=1 Tax=Cupriavidus sp. TMH.W2 TaxID=3434465 RepID=UPI003D770A39
MLVNISGAFPAIFAFCAVLFALAGVVLVAMGVYGFYVIHYNDGRTPGGRNIGHAGAASNVVIGALLTGLMYITALTKNTVLGTEIQNGSMGFQSSGMTATQQAAITALFGLFAILGFIASGRGWMLLNRFFSGTEKEWAGAIAYIIGGMLCVYMEESMVFVTRVTGFDFVKIFLF